MPTFAERLAASRPHTHTAATSTESMFEGPVALPAYQNRAAHGGICRTETCACGSTRKVLINGRHRESAPWNP